MTLTTTSLYALPLIVILAILWVRVASARAQLGQSIGDGGNMELLLKVRQHGNFIEWVPFTLVLMVLAEAQGTDALWMHATGALLVIGRVIHPFGLKIDNAAHPLRYIGNTANLIALLSLLVALGKIVTGL